MRVISTNIAEPKIISWRGKDVQTGIYKFPVDQSIYLDKEDVKDDHVIDRRYHGGVDKACYLYSVEHYPYWKEKYPDLEWNYGMFGENLTVEGFDESSIKIGNIYKLGGALVQISRPRQPCYKLGVRFENQKIIKEFIDSLFSGVYVRVLKSGKVSTGDEFILEEENKNGVSIKELNTLLFHYSKETDSTLLKTAVNDPLVAEGDKKYFKKHLA
ncbi:MOSC domain-containing protein [Aquimarina sp. AD10]|uniref:MOSC domain-containing protein n=1 Tax=Aquimarina sp. AD10 TaxID=1714849 RepID=UPI000E54B2C7|nr:MOSC domain-containing protein [Aquimarina sp. AD10]AXT59901.1 MOSC domain-containing protein [Aquimarina sp. AD10]RKN00181.1 MOSC domain-containing protein [Aquimarina sp. AD10]